MVKERWKKATQYLTKLLNQWKEKYLLNTYETSPGESGAIKLDPVIYAELQELAKQEETSIEVIIYRTIESYKSGQHGQQNWKISVERKEKNPILLLEGIAKIEHKQEKRKNEEEANDASRQPVNW